MVIWSILRYMSNMTKLKNLTDEELLEACDTFTSATEFLKSLNIVSKGQYSSVVNTRRIELGLEWKLKQNRILDKICPVCNIKFRPGTKKQTTCSYSCANTHFRSGENNPNFKHGGDQEEYRRICFAKYPRKCIVCGEVNIVAVHHYDEDHSNNCINNLVPLCPTHHTYMHSKFKYLIEDIVKEWITENNT
jgi:hypothetical protein